MFNSLSRGTSYFKRQGATGSHRKKTYELNRMDEREFIRFGGLMLAKVREAYDNYEFEIEEKAEWEKDIHNVVFSMGGKFCHVSYINDEFAYIVREDGYGGIISLKALRIRLNQFGGFTPFRKDI